MSTEPKSPLSVESPGGGVFYKPLLGGLAWTATVKWSIQLLSWASTLVVARLLSPADFGLVGMATVYLGFVTLLSEFGVGSAVVYLRELTDEQVAQLNSLSVVLGIAAFGISCAMARPVAWFFRLPSLTLVVVVMSTGFIISAFRVIPYALLQRDKAFKLLAIADGCGALAQALSTVVSALLGWRYWSLVLGGILGSCSSAGVLLWWRRTPFALPRSRSIRQAMEFAGNIIVSRLSWYAYSNSDFVVAGRVLGRDPLGAYTIAWNLASASIEKVTDLIGRVIPTFISAAQKDAGSLRRYLRNLTEGISLITFPATLGLALVSRDFILLALGTKWAGAVVPLQLLALYASIRSITILLAPVMNAVDVRWGARYGLLFVVVFPTAFYVGSRWGTVGIASGWVCLYPLIYIPIYRHIFRCINMKLREYLGAIWPALSTSLAMAIGVIALKLAVPSGWARGVRLGAEILGGASIYVLVLATAHRGRFRALVQILRAMAR